MSNYVSPYGFSPLTDMAIDSIASRHELNTDQMADILFRAGEDTANNIIDRWWKHSMEYALDYLDELLSEIVTVDPDVVVQDAMLESGQSVLGPR